MVYPTLLAAISDVAHPSWRGSSVGVYRLWRDSGFAVGAILAGVLADRFGLAVAIEHGGAEQVNDRVQSWLSRTRHVEKAAVPRLRGKITIADVADAAPDEYAAAVRRWAGSVWDAWREHHALAREWIAAAGAR